MALPTLIGVPLVDLKAGDELYAATLLALAEQADRNGGRRIDISMLQVAASWLITLLPLVDLDCGPEEITRWGNAHRKFIPTNVYPTADGYIYLAIGSDAQWKRLVAIERFSAIASRSKRNSPEQRYTDRHAIYREVGEVTRNVGLQRLSEELSEARIPNAAIHDINQVHEMAAIRSRMTGVTLPGGKQVRLQPMAVDLPGRQTEFALPPAYGQNTRSVMREIGYPEEEIDALAAGGHVAFGLD